LSFEIRQKDLLGRIGKLSTKKGVVETPLLLPVVNPNHQLISAKDLRDKFGFEGLITNSYLVWKRFREEKTPDIHDLIQFDGVVETDSGAYQILQYGDVEVQPSQIIRFQEELGSDIAVILDIPTGDAVSLERAKWSVDETLRRADQAQAVITRRDILWVGPVQGGMYPELVAHSAREMAKRDFSIYALGSPTPVMQQYRFDMLVEMIMAAKLNLRPDRPLHLFGAGHPMMFAMAVALGCDMFDSASYALFARNGRYMTVNGTLKLEEMEYFPCGCPICHGTTPEKIRRMLPTERERFLASHNLNSCFIELQTVKQAVVDGRLWELVESRSRNHPTLQRAFQAMLRYTKALELETPVRKRKGPFVISPSSLNRPEVLRYRERIAERYSPPKTKSMLLIPEDALRLFTDDPDQENWIKRLEKRRDLHPCSYSLVYGIVPLELVDIYPLSQTEHALTPTRAAVKILKSRITDSLKLADYSSLIFVARESWQKEFAKSLQVSLRRKMKFRTLTIDRSLSELTKFLGRSRRRQRIS
jgi:7-cyano-7-deazaguanine tRNA-ribosyltransferase